MLTVHILNVYRRETLKAFQWLGDFPLPLDPNSVIFLDEKRKGVSKPDVEPGDWIVCRISFDSKVQAIYVMDGETFYNLYAELP